MTILQYPSSRPTCPDVDSDVSPVLETAEYAFTVSPLRIFRWALSSPLSPALGHFQETGVVGIDEDGVVSAAKLVRSISFRRHTSARLPSDRSMTASYLNPIHRVPGVRILCTYVQPSRIQQRTHQLSRA